jgi:hypothetical protein
MGQGRENCKLFLEQNPSIADEIEQKLRKLAENAADGFIDELTTIGEEIK